MVGASPQDIRPQESQVPPTPVGPAYYPQQPYHPAAGGYMQPPYPPQGMGAPGDAKKAKSIVSIGNFSLLAIIFTLILFGTFTFLGGFLLGMWLESPARLPVTVEKESVSASPAAASSSQPQDKSAKPVENSEQKSKIADILGDTVGETVSDVQTPDVPDFLTPLITEAQDAASQQAASKTQKAVEQVQNTEASSSQPPSPGQPQTAVQPQAAPQLQSPISSQRRGLLPTHISPGTLPSSSPSSAAAQPVSAGKGEYSVQLGVYAARENAEALQDTLQALNYTTYITPGKSSDGSTLYYVHSGSYRNYATATEAAAQFTSRNIPGAVVIKISKNGNDAS